MASIYSVKQVTAYISNMFSQDYALNRILIKGEISNCKYHTSGHIYFTLKDDSSMIACVMFAGNAKNLTFRMREGQRVVAGGSIRVYERDGKYQMYVTQVRPDGTGDLYHRFELLKQKLSDMGMFAPEYKQPIPSYATKIGIVTAPTGAAIQDMIHISFRRNPYVQLYLYPALVQGDGAPESIIRGIACLDSLGLDCLIVGRGGGSIEDLWAFNDEGVARAIFDCETPVISAVGHETDFTIADFVADMRAPTPSAAAELAVFDYAAFEEKLKEQKRRLEAAAMDMVFRYRSEVEKSLLNLRLLHPGNRLLQEKQYLADLEDRLLAVMERKVETRRHVLEVAAARLNGLSPLARLSGGYVWAMDENEKPLESVTQAAPGSCISLLLKDGKLNVTVNTRERRAPEHLLEKRTGYDD